MATLQLRGKTYSIRFTLHGERKLVAAGTTSERQANRVLDYVEALLKAAHTGCAVDQQTAMWLSAAPRGLQRRLAKVGLIELAGDAADVLSLKAFLSGYMASRTADAKTGTMLNLRQAEGYLVNFFGDRPLEDVTPGDCDEYARWIRTKVGDNTARRHLGRAKQFFRAALRKRLISENPFGEMKGLAVQANRSREFFVTREAAAKVLEACPDNEWRLLFVLARYAGLRTPSEPIALTWANVDWERRRLRVPAVKTAERFVPIFPEVLPYLETAFNEASPGAEYVITRYRDSNANLRTQFERIVRRAGVACWKKPFQNLRSTRETELAEDYPLHVVCSWIGNSEAVAKKHYLQVTDAHFEQAATNVTTFVATPRRTESQDALCGAVSSQPIAGFRTAIDAEYPYGDSNPG